MALFSTAAVVLSDVNIKQVSPEVLTPLLHGRHSSWPRAFYFFFIKAQATYVTLLDSFNYVIYTTLSFNIDTKKIFKSVTCS